MPPTFCDNFLHDGFQGHALRARQAARVGRLLGHGRESRRGRGTSGRPAAGAGVGRGTRRCWAAAWPAPLARERTGAGRCRYAGSPAPARWRSPPSRTPGGRTCKSWPGGPPAPGEPNAAQRSQSRSYVLAALRALHLDSDLPRQDRRLAGGRHYLVSAVAGGMQRGSCQTSRMAARAEAAPVPAAGGTASSLRRPVTGA
jgi:hypothetical protein